MTDLKQRVNEWDHYFSDNCELAAAAIMDLFEYIRILEADNERLRAEKYVVVSGDSLRNDNEALQAEIERLQKRIKFIYTSSNGDLYAEIERLRVEQGQYEEELERLRASLNNDMFEKMADEIDSLETQIERLRDALYEIAHMDPIRRIQGDAQRVAKKALENKE